MLPGSIMQTAGVVLKWFPTTWSSLPSHRAVVGASRTTSNPTHAPQESCTSVALLHRLQEVTLRLMHSGLSAERLGTSSAIPEVAEERPQSSHQQDSPPQDSSQWGPRDLSQPGSRDSSQRGLRDSSQRSLRECPSESWVRLQPQSLPDEDLGEPGGSSSTSPRPMLPLMVVSRVQ